MNRVFAQGVQATSTRNICPNLSIDKIVQVLLPRTNIASVTLSDRIGEWSKTLLRLTDEQYEVVRALQENRRMRVEGCAGSGKTILALQQANALAAAGFCHSERAGRRGARNPPTTERIVGDRSVIPRGRGGGWARNPPTTERIVGDPICHSERAGRWAGEESPDRRWDADLVDEAQDFQPSWWIPTEMLLADGTGCLWVFYDPRQNIYGSSEVPWASWPLITLRKNCRNTRSVARWALDHIASKPELPDQTPDGMEVVDVICPDRCAMLETLRGWIHELTMERHLTADRILILTPYRRDTSVLFGATKIGNWTIEEYPAVTRNACRLVDTATLQRTGIRCRTPGRRHRRQQRLFTDESVRRRNKSADGIAGGEVCKRREVQHRPVLRIH